MTTSRIRRSIATSVGLTVAALTIVNIPVVSGAASAAAQPNPDVGASSTGSSAATSTAGYDPMDPEAVMAQRHARMTPVWWSRFLEAED